MARLTDRGRALIERVYELAQERGIPEAELGGVATDRAIACWRQAEAECGVNLSDIQETN